MKPIIERAVWWVRDYAYAGVWQVRAFFDRTDPRRYRTGDRAAVLLIPGVYETWRFMQPLAERIHARGHPVHVLEGLGRNRSAVVSAGELVETYLVENDLHDVVIVAHSKGGLIGKRVLVGSSAERIRGMVAIATPFGGSGYARLMLIRTLRSFSPRDETIVELGRALKPNARIVSIFARFDPHIPEGSELAGATNIRLDTGGHFRILAHPRVIAEVLASSE